MQRALAEASTTECDQGSNPVEYSESLAPSVFSRQATHVSYAVHGTSMEDVLVHVLFISQNHLAVGKTNVKTTK